MIFYHKPPELGSPLQKRGTVESDAIKFVQKKGVKIL